MKSNLDEMETVWYDFPEVVLIKMADRLHNLQTISGFSIEKQKEYLHETKDLLLPLFKKILKRNHLGHLKSSLETLVQQLSQEIVHIEKRFK